MVQKSTLGKVLKFKRIERDMSQKDVCREVGITTKYLSDIECGKYFPSFNLLGMIVDLYKVPLWQIIKEAEEMGERNGN